MTTLATPNPTQTNTTPPRCDVHNPHPCTNEAAFTATKHCGCTTHLCIACWLIANNHIITCTSHRCWFPPGRAYQDINPL